MKEGFPSFSGEFSSFFGKLFSIARQRLERTGFVAVLGRRDRFRKIPENRPKFRGAAYGRSARGHANRVNGRDCVSWCRVRQPLFLFAG
jgi:hypothetical protein